MAMRISSRNETTNHPFPTLARGREFCIRGMEGRGRSEADGPRVLPPTDRGGPDCELHGSANSLPKPSGSFPASAPCPSRVSPPGTRLFLTSLRGSSGPGRHTLQPQAIRVKQKVIPPGAAKISGCIFHVNHGCFRRARGRKIPCVFPANPVWGRAAGVASRKTNGIGPRAWPGITCPFFQRAEGAAEISGALQHANRPYPLYARVAEIGDRGGSFECERPSPRPRTPPPGRPRARPGVWSAENGFLGKRPHATSARVRVGFRTIFGGSISGFRKSAGHLPADR